MPVRNPQSPDLTPSEREKVKKIEEFIDSKLTGENRGPGFVEVYLADLARLFVPPVYPSDEVMMRVIKDYVAADWVVVQTAKKTGVRYLRFS